jgi:hypothetical protein
MLSGTPTDNDVGSYWVNVTVLDGNGGFDWQNFTLTVKATMINNNPVITTQNVVTITEGEDYEVTYVATDDRTPVNNLVWHMSTDANWLEFDESKKILSGTPQALDVGSYWVNITVSDSEGGLGYTNFTLTVKKLDKPTNKNPVLTNGQMTPSSGDTDTEFTFTVIYTDADNESGDVYVWIDNEKYEMTPDLDDTDYTDGVEYTFKTKLSKGSHDYYFSASDGTDLAIPGDSTPTSAEDIDLTPEVEETEEKEDDNLLMFLFLIIILIIIVLIIAFVMNRRSKGEIEEEFDENELEEELEDLEDEELVDEEFDEELEEEDIEENEVEE